MNTAVRRKLTDFFDTLEQLIKTPIVSLIRLIRCIGRPNQVVSPTPRALVNKVYNRAKLEALPYGPNEPRVCPGYFTVTVPQGSWEEFYRHDTAQIAADIAERVHTRIRESETITIDRAPIITIECSARPDCEGTTVTAHFYTARPDAPRATRAAVARQPQVSAAAAAPASAGKAAQAPVPRAGIGPDVATGARDASPEDRTVLMHRAGSTVLASEPPRGKTETSPLTPPAIPVPKALLQDKDESYLVHDGDVIGVVRGESPVRPTICLPLERFPFASREHARLSYDAAADTWMLTQLGRHGSRIVHDGNSVELAPGEPHVLANGDVIAIPRANSELVFSAEKPVGTALFTDSAAMPQRRPMTGFFT